MDADFGAGLRANDDLLGAAFAGGLWKIRCYGPDGELKWEEPWGNAITSEGQDHLLNVTLAGGAQSSTWYIGLIDGSTPTVAESDTLSSKGWTENEAYSEAARQTWSNNAVSGQSVDNSGSEASFSIDTDAQTIGGAFLADDDTKGGTTGTLYAAGTFSNDKSADSGDTLEVTATFTMASN